MPAFRFGVFALLLCSVLLTASRLQADTVPPDPIIDTELGSGSYAFNGQIQLRILWSDLNPTMNCHAVGESGDATIDDCTGAGGGFITKVHVLDAQGNDLGLQSDTLQNDSGKTIINLDFLLSQSQGPFSPTSPFSAPEGAVFSQVTNVSQFEGIYGLGPNQQGICTSNVDFESSCPTEVSIGLKDILINEGGQLNITLTSNVPEPGSAVLLLSTLPGVWIARRRWRK